MVRLKLREKAPCSVGADELQSWADHLGVLIPGAHHTPPSHIRLDGAGVLFSSSDGRAEVRSDKPRVTQRLSVKTGFKPSSLKPAALLVSWLCHFPGRHKSSVVFITHCWHLPLLRDHHTSVDPYTHTWVYTKPKQKMFLTDTLLPYTLLSILF